MRYKDNSVNPLIRRFCNGNLKLLCLVDDAFIA